MPGKISSRLNEDTVALIKSGNREYFLGLYAKLKEKEGDFGFRLGGADARTETEKLDNGDFRVRFFIPLDSNNDPADGRLYIVDQYTFSGKDVKNFSFGREVVYNQRGMEKGKWRSLRDFLNDPEQTPLPTPEQQQKFARQVALSFSRPIDSSLFEKIKTFLGEERGHLEKGEAPYYFYPIGLGASRKAGLQVRIHDGDFLRERQSRLSRVERSNGYEIVLSYVLDDTDPKTHGNLMVQDRFIFLDMDEPVAFRRDVVVANGSGDKEHWEKVRRKFYQKDGKTLQPDLMPTEEGWKKFFSEFKEDLLRFEPDFGAASAEMEEELQETLGKAGTTPLSVEEAMARVAEDKFYLPADQYEPAMASILAKQTAYFQTLNEVGGQDFPLELDRLPLDLQVRVQGEETHLSLRYTFADPSFDGVPRGKITLTETFHFKGKSFVGVERQSSRNGPDPDGRLASVWARLQKKLGDKAFPDQESPLTKHFLNQTLAYLAPHVLVKPGEVEVLSQEDVPMLPEERGKLESLQKIEAGLVGFLYHPKFDPKFRNQILRVIRDSLYQKGPSPTDPRNDSEDTAPQDPMQTLVQMSVAEGSRLNPYLAALEQEKKKLKPDERVIAQMNKNMAPIQDRKQLVDSLLAISMGRMDKAANMAAAFHSSHLKGLMEKILGPLQRQNLNLEGLTLMEKVAQDLIAKEAKDSDRWIGGKTFDRKAAAEAVGGLFEKAREKLPTVEADSPLALLGTLEGLSGAERAERRRLLASPLIRQLDNIAQERMEDPRGRQYFIFAKGPLMAQGLVGSANFIGKWVALHHMPPTRSIEGLKVLEALAPIQLQFAQQEKQQEKLAELTAIAQAVNPEAMAQLPPEQAQALQKEFREKYGELQAHGMEDLKTFADPQQFFALEDQARDEFFKRVLKTYGPEVLLLQNALYVNTYLLTRAVGAAQKDPNKNFHDLLMGLKGLSEGEEAARRAILADPFMAALMEKNKAATPEARQKGYQEVFQEYAQSREHLPLIMGMMAQMKEQGFPHDRAAEGLFLADHIVLGAMTAQMSQAFQKPLLEKMQKDIQEELQKAQPAWAQEAFLQAQALQVLFEKARDMAVSRPEMEPMEVLGLVTDEEIERDLEQALTDIESSKAWKHSADGQDEKSVKEKKAKARKFVKALYAEVKRQRKTIAEMPIQKKLGRIFSEDNAVKRQEAYRKFFGETSARFNYFQMLLQIKTGRSPDYPKELVEEMESQANYSPDVKAKIEQIKSTEDLKQLQSLVQEIQGSEDFQFSAYLPAIAGLQQNLSMGELVVPGSEDLIEANPLLKEEEIAQIRMMSAGQFPRKNLSEFVAHTEGRGDLSTKVDYGASHLMGDVTRPTMVAAMTGAFALGAVTESALLTRMGTLTGRAYLWGSRGAAAGAVAAEGFVLNTGQKALDSAFYTREGQWENYWGDQKATWLTFGLWRVGQGLVTRFGREILAAGKCGKWAGGPVAVKEIPVQANPVGRLSVAQAGPKGSVFQTTRAGAAVESLAQHGVGIGSIMASQISAPKLGWQKEDPDKTLADHLVDATGFYLSGLIGARLSQSLPLGGLNSSILMLRHQNEIRKLEKKLTSAKVQADIPELVDGKVLEAQLERAQKKAEEISKEQAVPTFPAELPVLRLVLENLLGPRLMEQFETKLEEGKLWIKYSAEGAPKGSEPVQVGGDHLKPDQWKAIEPDASIKTAQGEFKLGDPRAQKAQGENFQGQMVLLQTLQSLADLPLPKQYSLARLIAAASDLPALQKTLEGFWSHTYLHNAPGQLAQLIRWVQMGAFSLEALPRQLGFRGKIEEHISKEVARWEREGLIGDSMAWKDGLFTKELPEIQIKYLQGRYASHFETAIAKAKSLEEMTEILGNSPIQALEGKSVQQLILDLPAEGQAIQALGIQRKLGDLGQDPAAISDLPHVRTLNRLVRKHLDPRTPEDLASTQNVLRYHLDHMTAEAGLMLRRGVYLGGINLKNQKGLLDLYLGNEGARVMPSAARGLEILTALGRHGVAAKMVLVLEKGSQGRERVVLRRGTAGPDDLVLARTRDLSQKGAAKVERALWTPKEVKGFIERAMGRMDTGPLHSLLIHPQGGMDVLLAKGEAGNIRVDINYSLRDPSKAEFEPVEKVLEGLKEMKIPGVDVHVKQIKKFSAFLDNLSYLPPLPPGWGRAKVYIPQFPPLHPSLRFPHFKFSLGGYLKGKVTSWGPWETMMGSLKKSQSKNKPNEEQQETGSIERELEQVLDEVLSEAPQPSPQIRAELQVRAANLLHGTLARMGKFEEGQLIEIEVPLEGDFSRLSMFSIPMEFVVDLAGRQVRMTEETVRRLEAMEAMPDSQLNGLIAGLIEMKDQSFSLPLSNN